MYKEQFKVNNRIYKTIKLLGKGKSGYSFLVYDENNFKYCLKQIHHEPCDYYNFGDKLKAEINDYDVLKNFIPLPKLYDVDYENEIIVKEYIDGELVSDLIQNNKLDKSYMDIIIKYALICKENGLNIDYYPTNFIISNNCMYYVDYECNEYMKEYDFDNWGRKYWIKNMNTCS